MILQEILERIDVWEDWRENYKTFVPQFIQEASRKMSWQEWDKVVFQEYFERSNGQCVSSLQQGYFTNNEKEIIKQNWQAISPILKHIADSQDVPQFDAYAQLKSTILQWTDSNKEAAIHRLVAGLQPKLLSTIVSYKHLNELYGLLINKANIKIPDYSYQNWFKDSHLVWQFFKKTFPSKDPYDLITYPWQTLEFLRGTDINKFSMELKLQELVSLITYKKQIILQGPPGTGKTKIAKELAQALCGFNKGGVRHTIIDKLEIQRLLNGVDKIKTKSGKDLIIVLIKDGVVQVKTEDSQVWSPSYNKIIESYNSKLFDRDGRTGGFTPYEDAIAKYLYEHHYTSENEMSSAEIGQVSLVQFHPSYSYEDFVRGIVAKPNEDGDGVLYEAEDKIISKLANDALENYRLSQVVPESSSQLVKIQNDLERFIRHVQESIADSADQKYPLTDDVYLFSSDATRFKYKGDNWVAHSKGLNMKYSELQKIIAASVTERAHIKNLPEVEELTRQHATYFFNTYKKFQEFVASNPAPPAPAAKGVPLMHYVLIIDEINRANLSSVLGELIYALEYRGEGVESIYDAGTGNKLVLPPNLYIIGTMNTADRSVGHIDYAIRRRFAFVDVLPEVLPLDFETALFEKVSSLFVEDLHASPLEASEHLSSEFKFKDVWLGHSYFIKKKDVASRIRLKYEIIPILEEYIKDGVLKDTDAVAKIIAELESTIA